MVGMMALQGLAVNCTEGVAPGILHNALAVPFPNPKYVQELFLELYSVPLMLVILVYHTFIYYFYINSFV